MIQAQFDSALNHTEDVTVIVQMQDEKILLVCVERNQLQYSVGCIQTQITDLNCRVGICVRRLAA